jgi:hypothetical protein
MNNGNFRFTAHSRKFFEEQYQLACGKSYRDINNSNNSSYSGYSSSPYYNYNDNRSAASYTHYSSYMNRENIGLVYSSYYKPDLDGIFEGKSGLLTS